MKGIFLFLFILVCSVNVFSQNINKKKLVKKDTIPTHADTTIDIFEMQGIALYKEANYDEAILRFQSALNTIDSVMETRKNISDFINSSITQCNIATCYCKAKNFNKCLKNLPAGTGAGFNCTQSYAVSRECQNFMRGKYGGRLNAFVELTTLDYRIALKQHQLDGIMTEGSLALDELRKSKFTLSDTLAYRYALKGYSYLSIYKEIGECLNLKKTGDNYTSSDIYNAFGDYYNTKGDIGDSRINYQNAIKYKDK